MEFNIHSLPALTEPEFLQFKKLIYETAGIDLAPTKKMLVAGRLGKRVRHYQLKTFHEYYQLVTGGANPAEMQVMVDLLTTNETYFYREPEHFLYLKDKILPAQQVYGTYRAWSAACSSGEEAYTLAMLLMEAFGDRKPWEVVGTDISMRMLDMARAGHYLMDAARILPKTYLARYCLRGVRSQEGTFLVNKDIRKRVKFVQANLNQELKGIGQFDLVFLRNVLIYFNPETKQQVVRRILAALRSGGYFFIGHAESLMGLSDKSIVNGLEAVAPTIYRKR